MRTFIVIGQRRSGTSLVSGVLEKLGIPMGSKGETSERNPKGFYEDRSFVEISEKIMGVVQSNPNVKKLDIEKTFRDSIKEAVKNRGVEDFGFKDVNQLYTHTFFKKHLKDPHYIYTFRNHLDIAQSISDWHGMSIPEALEQVANHSLMQAAMVKLTTEPMYLFSFERCLKNPENAVDGMIEFLGITPTDEQRKAAIEHIDPSISQFNG